MHQQDKPVCQAVRRRRRSRGTCNAAPLQIGSKLLLCCIRDMTCTHGQGPSTAGLPGLAGDSAKHTWINSFRYGAAAYRCDVGPGARQCLTRRLVCVTSQSDQKPLLDSSCRLSRRSSCCATVMGRSRLWERNCWRRWQAQAQAFDLCCSSTGIVCGFMEPVLSQ